MEIKRIENLNKNECREYLHNNSNSELAKEVQGRLNAILAAEEKARQREESERKASVALKNKWIDINQFLEETKYRNRRGLRNFLVFLFLICLSFVLITLYFTNSTHCIYSQYDYEQCNYVYGLENILLNLEFIRMPWFWSDSDTVFPTWDNYREGGTFCVFLVIDSILLVFYLIVFINNSPLVGKIYNIEDGTKADKYRPMQDMKGKSGLCELGFSRIKTLLPFQYDLVVPAKENSFICYRNSKYGLYNGDTKKIVIPLEYDEIYSIDDTVIKVVKNGEIYSFSYKGYRIIE